MKSLEDFRLLVESRMKQAKKKGEKKISNLRGDLQMSRINKKHLTSAILLAAFIALLLMQLVRASPISVSITPLAGPVGTTVVVSGLADTPSGNVSIYFDINGNGLTEIGEFQKNATASMTAPYIYGTTITVPPSTAGTHAIIATDVEAGTSTGAYFRVVPQITISPDSGPVGTVVTVTGTGFDRTSTITITFKNIEVTPSPTPVTNEVGSFTADFSVPPLVKGEYSVKATDAAGNFGLADFTLFGITVSITPTSGPVGTLVAVSGTQATPSGLVKIWWDNTEVVSVTAGEHTLTAEDAESTNTAAKTFTVEPQIVLSKTEGFVATDLSVTGTGFAGNAFVDISFDATIVVDDFATDSTGGFTADFIVPASVAGGHTVTATDTVDEKIKDSAQFTVIPKITIDVTEGRIGTEVQVSGTGFAGANSIKLTFDDIDVTPSPSPETSKVGSFTTSFLVPPIPAGTHTLTAIDESDNEATATFTVWDLTISITPTKGPVGTVVTVTGANATPKGTVTIRWDSVEVGTAIAGTDGTYSFEFKVPASIKGDHTVAAEDVQSTNTATKTFMVEPQIILTPEDGVVGDSVLVTGNGFSSLAKVDVYFNKTLVSSNVLTNESGSFSMTFLVPWVSTAGNYPVKAIDAKGVTDDATFTVLFVMYTRSGEYFQGDYPSFFIQAVDENGEPLEGAVVVVSINDSARYLEYKGVTFTIGDGTVPYDMQFFNWYVWYYSEAFELSPLHLPSDATVGTWKWTATAEELVVSGSFEVIEPVDLRTLLNKLDQLLEGQDDIAGLIAYYGDKLQLDHEDLIVLIESVAEKLQMDHKELADLVTEVFNNLGIKLDDIKAEIIGIEEKVDGLYLVIGDLEVKLDYIKAKLVEVQGNIATIVTDIGTIKTDISNINAKITNIEGRLATIETDIGTIQVDIADINGQITSINGRLATITTSIGTIQTDISTINGILTSIEGNIATIITDIGTIKTDVNNINAKIVAIEGRLATIETDVGTVKVEVTAINAKLTDIQGRITTIETDIGTIKTDVSAINGHLAAIDGRLATIESDVGTIKTDISNINGKIGSIQEGMATIKTDIGDLEVKLADIKAQIVGVIQDAEGNILAAIDTALGQITVRFDQIDAKLVSIEGDIATISTTLGEIEAKIDEMGAVSLEEIKGDIATIKSDIGTIKVNVNNINANITSIKGRLVTIETTVGTIQEDIDDINGKIVAIEGRLATIETDIGKINTDISTINGRLTKIEGSIATIETDIGTIKTDIGKINGKIVAIEGRLATVETDIGKINADISAINGKIVAIEGETATIKTDIGIVKTSLTDINTKITVSNDNIATIQTDTGTIKGRLTTVEGDIATIETDIGTIKTSASNIEKTGESIKSDTGLQPATVALSLIAAIAAIAAAAMVLRKVYMK